MKIFERLTVFHLVSVTVFKLFYLIECFLKGKIESYSTIAILKFNFNSPNFASNLRNVLGQSYILFFFF